MDWSAFVELSQQKKGRTSKWRRFFADLKPGVPANAGKTRSGLRTLQRHAAELGVELVHAVDDAGNLWVGIAPNTAAAAPMEGRKPARSRKR